MNLVNNNFLAITLTKKCNLRCNYCFEEANPNNDGVFQIEKVMNLIREAKSLNIRWIALSGGEPLLYPYIYELINEIAGLGLSLFIESNGIAINERFIREIKSRIWQGKVQIRISLDSNVRLNHEKDRGVNSFLPAIKSIQNLVRYGINVSVNKVYRSNDFAYKFNLKDYVEFCLQLGVNRIEISRIVPLGRAQERDKLSLEQVQYVRRLLEELKKHRKSILSNDFYMLKYSQNCSRLQKIGWGLYAYPYGFSLCPMQPEIRIGDLSSMNKIIEGNILNVFNEMRKAAFRNLPYKMIFGCSECREYFYKANKDSILKYCESF